MKGTAGREQQLLPHSNSSFHLQQNQQLTFLCVFHFMCLPHCPWPGDHNPTAELGTTQENVKWKKTNSQTTKKPFISTAAFFVKVLKAKMNHQVSFRQGNPPFDREHSTFAPRSCWEQRCFINDAILMFTFLKTGFSCAYSTSCIILSWSH